MLASTFTFFGATFESFFVGTNVSSPTPKHPTFGWKSFAAAHAKLVRSDSELTVDLEPVLQAQFLPTIQKLLEPHPELVLTGGPFAQIALWFQVPYFFSRPLDHPINTTLVRVYIDLHVKTPWPASDADATLSFYIFVRLQNGKLKASVDGAWVDVDGGWPDGQAIADALGKVAKGAIPTVQSGLDTALAIVGNKTFSDLYLIPGNGVTTPVIAGDATQDTTIGLVP